MADDVTPQKKKFLSASGISTYEKCSWLFWTQTENKVPQEPNDGALRGIICHSVFELLLNPRHKKHYNLIVKQNNISGSPAVERMIKGLLKGYGIFNIENFNLINDMILVGLKTDFFPEGGKIGTPEYRFEIENDDPKYKIRGYIDVPIFYPNDKVVIRDFKSSKAQFSADELSSNVQSFTYSLVAYKQFNAKDVFTQFIFLRFPKKPTQLVHPTKTQLKGFEHYLAHLYSWISTLNENSAQSNMAAKNSKNSWLCKAGKWTCPYMRAFHYYALRNPDGSIARTSLKKNMKIEEGQKLEVLEYKGCPYWNNKKTVEL